MSSKPIDLTPASVEFMHATGHPGASLFKVAETPTGPTPEQYAAMGFAQRMALADSRKAPAAPRPVPAAPVTSAPIKPTSQQSFREQMQRREANLTKR